VEGLRGRLSFAVRREPAITPAAPRRLDASGVDYMGWSLRLRDLGVREARERLNERPRAREEAPDGRSCRVPGARRPAAEAARGAGAPDSPRESVWEIFDRDEIRGSLWIRPWRDGDRIRPYGMNGSKLVSDLLNERRISAREKRSIPVIEDEAGILWVLGVRRAARAAVGDGTRRVLEVSGVSVS
jgi:tRNA(Ile)-lysidine synthetase-like protein